MMKITRHCIVVALAIMPLVYFSAFAQAEMNKIGQRLMAAVPRHGDKSLGDPKAPVVMIEYASATCPHCAEFYNDIWPAIKKDYVDTGKVFFIFREMPTDNKAVAAFMIARCVPKANYFATIAQLFKEQEAWMKKKPKEELFRIGMANGLDAIGAEACIKRRDLAEAIVETRRRAAEEFGVRRTPTFFVNGFITDAHDDVNAVKAVIDRMLSAGE
jgi:protein-disulfide isomerase